MSTETLLRVIERALVGNPGREPVAILEAVEAEYLLVDPDAPTITIDDEHPMGRLASLEDVVNVPAGRYIYTGPVAEDRS